MQVGLEFLATFRQIWYGCLRASIVKGSQGLRTEQWKDAVRASQELDPIPYRT